MDSRYYPRMDRETDSMNEVQSLLNQKNIKHIFTKEKYSKNSDFLKASSFGLIPDMKIALDNGADVSSADNYALVTCCSKGYTQAVKFLLENGADVNARNSAPLFYSIKYGYRDIIELLMNNNATILEYFFTLAIRYNNHEIVSLFLQKNFKPSKDDIMFTIVNNNDEIQKVFVNHGINPNETGMTEWAMYRMNQKLLTYFISKDYKLPNYLLIEAIGLFIECNNTGMVEYLIETHDITPDIIQYYHICSSVNNNYVFMLALLNNKGLIRKFSQAEKNELLFNAVQDGYNDIIKILISAGADVHKNNGELINECIYNGYWKTAKILLEYW